MPTVVPSASPRFGLRPFVFVSFIIVLELTSAAPARYVGAL